MRRRRRPLHARIACNGSGACAAGDALDCDDGNVCTQDSCDPLDRLRQHRRAVDSPACRPVKATIQVKDSPTNDAGDRLKLKWKGGPVLLSRPGRPATSTRYELCIYDDSGVKMALGVAAGHRLEL